MVEGHNLTTEVNTRAAVIIVREETANSWLFPMSSTTADECDTLLTYTGQPISVLGQLFVKVHHDEVQETMLLQVGKEFCD